MGQQSSRASPTVAAVPEDAANVPSPRAASRRSSMRAFSALSRKLRSSSTRGTGGAWRSSLLKAFFKTKKSNSHRQENTTIATVESPISVASSERLPSPSPGPEASSSTSTAPVFVPNQNMTSPESLTIMEGAISTNSPFGRRDSVSHSSTISADPAVHDNNFNSNLPSTSSSSDQEMSNVSSIDERLQSSIDILAALLSMATAATATSLLTGTTDVLSTLASDSPSGPQVSPTRARAAWDILQSLFYLRLNRASNIAPHMELFRDLALAVLTARTVNAPITTGRDRPELPQGSFERFLVELNASVRSSLREDYTQRGSSNSNAEAPRRLNWWRAYQFDSLPVEQNATSAPPQGQRQSNAPNQPDSFRSFSANSTSSEQGNDPSHTATPTTQSRSGHNLVPVVLVGLRAISRESDRPTPVPTFSTATRLGSSAENSQTSTGRADRTSSAPDRSSGIDNVEAITSSYVIIVLGGHYPPGHRFASEIGSEDANELDQLWDLVGLVPTGPKTATQEEIVRAGLSCFKASEISEAHAAANTVEKCLICLEEYAPDNDLRLLKCTHAFHRDCVDRWLTEGQNGCPLCRTPVVPR